MCFKWNSQRYRFILVLNSYYSLNWFWMFDGNVSHVLWLSSSPFNLHCMLIHWSWGRIVFSALFHQLKPWRSNLFLCWQFWGHAHMSNLIFPLVSGNTEMHEIEGRNPKSSSGEVCCWRWRGEVCAPRSRCSPLARYRCQGVTFQSHEKLDRLCERSWHAPGSRHSEVSLPWGAEQYLTK